MKTEFKHKTSCLSTLHHYLTYFSGRVNFHLNLLDLQMSKERKLSFENQDSLKHSCLVIKFDSFQTRKVKIFVKSKSNQINPCLCSSKEQKQTAKECSKLKNLLMIKFYLQNLFTLHELIICISISHHTTQLKQEESNFSLNSFLKCKFQ